MNEQKAKELEALIVRLLERIPRTPSDPRSRNARKMYEDCLAAIDEYAAALRGGPEVTEEMIVTAVKAFWKGYSHPRPRLAGKTFDAMRAALEAVMPIGQQALADTQRAIIEAAEWRGYERGQADLNCGHGQQASADTNRLTIERDNPQARLEVMRERKDKAEAVMPVAESHKGLLVGTTPEGKSYALHGTPESVDIVSYLIDQDNCMGTDDV